MNVHLAMSCILQYAYPTSSHVAKTAQLQSGKGLNRCFSALVEAQIKAVLFYQAAGLPKQLVRSESFSVLQAPQNINREIMIEQNQKMIQGDQGA